MSTISTLGIQGIRSYSPTEQQVIKFEAPLSLILGKNGSGKTTIIETLRYITCGSLPPGCNNGKTFICDPKFINKNETNAICKLKFNAINKQPILCTRSMSLKRRSNKLEFKALEQTLKVKTPTENGVPGKELIVSHSQQEIDRQIPELLGVSRAVLENVIFCHQEDSQWPFRDHATLKAIFDELFETTKFTRLYETLQRLLKENKKKLKEEGQSLEITKYQYKLLVDDMQRLENVLKNIRHNLTHIKTEKKRRDELSIALGKDMNSEKMKLIENSRHLNEYQLLEAKTKMREFLDKLSAREYLGDSGEDTSELGTLEENKVAWETLCQQCSKLTTQIEDLESELTQGEVEYAQLREVTLDFDVVHEKEEILRFSHDLCTLLGIEPNSMDMGALIAKANAESTERDLMILTKEKTIEEQRGEAFAEMAREEYNIKYLQGEFERRQVYIAELNKGNRLDELEDLLKERQRLETDYVKVSNDQQHLKSQKESIKEEINMFVQKLKDEQDNRKKYDVAREHFDYHQAKNELAKSQAAKEAILKKLTVEKDDEVSFLGIEKMLKKMSLKLTKSEHDLKTAERESIEITALMASDDKLKRELEDEIKKIDQRIRAAFENKYPAEVDVLSRYDEIKVHIRDLERELEGAAFAKGVFLDAILTESKSREECVLCGKGFSHENFDCRKRIFDSIPKRTPEEAERFKELEDFRGEHKILKQHKADIIKAKNNMDRIVELDTRIAEMYVEAGKKTHRILILREEHKKLSEENGDLREMQILITKCDDCEHKIKKTDVSLFAGIDEDELAETYQKGVLKPADLATLLSEKQKSIGVVDSNLETLDIRLYEIRKLQKENNRRINIIKEEKKNEKSVPELEAEQERATEEIKRLTVELQTKRAERLEAFKAGNAEVEKEKTVLSRLNSLLLQLEQKHLNMVKLSGNGGTDSDLMSNYKRMKAIEARLEEVRKTVQELNKDKNKKEKDRLNLEWRVGLLESEAKVRNLEMLIANETAELQKLSKEVAKEQAIKDEMSMVSAAVSRLEGLDDGHKREAESIYKNIYNNRDKEMLYFQKLTMFEYYRMLVEDLEMYLGSLDQALVRYHKDKVEMINKNIAQLWKMTYMNKDITRIEIKAEQVVEASGEQKGNFNYRVVFSSKEDNQLDMRGRSSAGQRVLASIVIRIALAEAFGVNCGILTLDEPTTNLDEQNVKSLAKFLSDLIDQRRGDNNFQLVVITHDKEFLKMFSEYTDHYHEVSKEEHGFSTITKKGIEEVLHAL